MDDPRGDHEEAADGRDKREGAPLNQHKQIKTYGESEAADKQKNSRDIDKPSLKVLGCPCNGKKAETADQLVENRVFITLNQTRNGDGGS